MSNEPTSEHWSRDPRLEGLIKRLGLPIDLRLLKIDEIDWKAVECENVRFAGLDKDRVARYTESFAAGVAFPAFLVKVPTGSKNQRHHPLGGNHRGAAARAADIKEFLVYLVDTDDEELIDRLLLLTNVIEGVTATEDEKIARAIDRVENKGWTIERAALEFSTSRDVLSRQLRAYRVGDRLASLGIRNSQTLPKSTLADLDTLENDKVLVAVFSVACNARMTGEACHEMIKKVKKERTQESQLATIESEAKLRRVSTQIQPVNGALVQAPKMRKESIFRSILSRIIRFLIENPTLVKMGITRKSDRDWFHVKRDELIRLLEKL